MDYLSLEDAYRIQLRYAKLLKNISAWKLGGSNVVTSELFDVSVPYFGFLIEEQIFGTNFRSVAELELDTFEIEICVQTPKNYDSKFCYSAEDIRSWEACIGLEYPMTHIINMPKKGVAHLVADNCAAGALLLSSQKIDLKNDLHVTYYLDGIRIDETIELVSDVCNIVHEFLRVANENKFLIKPGQIIATGGISQLLKIIPGQTLVIKNFEDVILEYTR